MASVKNSPAFTGHCFSCDLADLMNAWSPLIDDPNAIFGTLLHALAQAVANNCKPELALNAGRALTRDFAKILVQALAEQKIDDASPHKAGHA